MKYLALFASTATLLCCALPALLVFLGLGAVVVSMVTAFPAITVLSEHKIAVFAVAFALIAVSWIMQRKNDRSCPAENAEACSTLKRKSSLVLIVSSALWCLGFTVAFLLPLFIR